MISIITILFPVLCFKILTVEEAGLYGGPL